MWTTCGPNVYVTMDTPLLAVRCYFRHCWTDGLCSEWGRFMPQRENFYRAVSSLYTKCSHHFASVGAEWGQITSEYWNDSFSPRILPPVSGPGHNCGDPGCLLSAPLPPPHPLHHPPSYCFCHVWGMCLELSSCWNTVNPFTY